MTDPPLLLTPGPLTTHHAVRAAMLRDWGSRESEFIELTAELRARLVAVAHGEKSHVAVPVQGSGTYAMEAAIATLLSPTDELLVLVNGAYGNRMAAIARRLGHRVRTIVWNEDEQVDPASVAAELAQRPASHVAIVQCETTSGILNPVDAVARIVADAGGKLIVDAMSALGALPLDLRSMPALAVLGSSNKCLEGVPGIAFALVDRAELQAREGCSASTVLDLHAQWRGFESDGQWRFTPPVQVAAALLAALHRLEAEGGPAARLARYQANIEVILDAGRSHGLIPFLDRAVQAPIIASFHMPKPPFSFDRFHAALVRRGFVIYPGKLTRIPTFRIGCIGDIAPENLATLSDVLGPALREADGPPTGAGQVR